MIALLLFACGGGETPTEPHTPEPPAAPAAEPAEPPAAAEPAPAAAMPKSKSKEEVLAAIPADKKGATTPMTNEMSGETYGEEVALTGDVTIGGVPCKAQAVQVSNEDNWGCWLGADHSFGPYTIKSDSYVSVYYATGTLGAVMLETLVPPVETLTVGRFTCREFVRLSATGGLEACTLAAEADGMPAGADVEITDGKAVELVGD